MDGYTKCGIAMKWNVFQLKKLTAGCLGLGRIEADCQRAWSIFWEVIKKNTLKLIVMATAQFCEYTRNQWTVFSKWMNFMIYELYLNETFESESEVAQLRLTLCDPMDCNLSGSSVHGIFQAIALECIAISFSSGSSRPRVWTQVFHILDRRFTIWATREAHIHMCAKSV